MVSCDTRQRHELVGPGGGQAAAMCCSRDGKLAAVGWESGRIAIVDLATYALSDCGYPLPIDSLDERRVNNMCFDEDGTHLAACGDDARLRLWTVRKLAKPAWETMLRSYAFVTCFCEPGRVAVGGLFEEILVFNCNNGKLMTRIGGANRTISLLYDSQRGHLVSGHADGRLRIHTGEDWQQVETLNAEAGEIVSLVGSPNWDNYVSGDSQGNLKIWSADQHEFIGDLQALPQRQDIAALCVDPVRHDLLVFHADRPTRDAQQPSELNCSRLSVRSARIKL